MVAASRSSEDTLLTSRLDAALRALGRLGEPEKLDEGPRVLIAAVRDLASAGYPASPLVNHLQIMGIGCDVVVQSPTTAAVAAVGLPPGLRTSLVSADREISRPVHDSLIRSRLVSAGRLIDDSEPLAAGKHPFTACSQAFGRLVAALVRRRHYAAIVVTEVPALWLVAELPGEHPPVIFLCNQANTLRDMDFPCLEVADVVAASSMPVAKRLTERAVASKIILSSEVEDGFRGIVAELDFGGLWGHRDAISGPGPGAAPTADLTAPDALADLATKLAERRRYDEAIEFISAAVAQDVASLPKLALLAELGLKAGNREIAADAAFRCLAVDPFHAPAWRCLETIYEAQGLTNLAREAAVRARMAGEITPVQGGQKPPPDAAPKRPRKKGK